MPEDTDIPLPHAQDSARAAYQVLAERAGVVQPGASMSEELFAFAEAVARMGEVGGTFGEGKVT
ncbi:MAG: hypothetical protein JWQ73_258 [Variovorax sp.]|jgi:hypothetical protein|nr:hypothetical protein [Variovorax sp.]